jgi:U3 small nucleolar ribonucleoprotein protein IMP3
MGLITAKNSLSLCANITASAFARRRLPVMLVRLKFAPTLTQAVLYVKHGYTHHKMTSFHLTSFT